MEDRELLQDYIATQSESAFSELVARHVNLVYSAARRMVGDDLAKDVSQAVFIDLARKPDNVRHPHALGGWLYRATQYAATQTLRTERRRQFRETEAMNRANLEDNSPVAWEAIAPDLDEALRRLKPVEMNAVVLRFFEGKSLQETGAALDLSENAVQKRITRALDKLRDHFAHRGITVSSALLATAITANSVQAAPVGLAASLSSTALAGAGSAVVSGSLLKTLYLTMKTKTIVLVAAVVAVSLIPTIIQHRQITRLQEELDAARARPGAGAEPKAAAHLSAGDQKAALSSILSLPSRSARLRKLIDLAAGLDAPSVQALLDDMAKQPITDDNRLAMGILMERMLQLDPKGAMAWAKGLPNARRSEEAITILFGAWAGIDPIAALAGTSQVDDASFRKNLQHGVLADLANYDPQKALTALQTLPAMQQSRNLRYLYDGVFATWAGNDPAAASAAVMNLPANRIRVFAIQSVVDGWAQTDPQGALAWSGNLPAGAVRSSAMNSVLGQIALQDSQAAIKYVGTMPDGTDRNNLIGQIAQSWAMSEPAAALAWVDQNATGSAHDGALTVVLDRLGLVDPVAAQAYIAQMPDNALRDDAVSQLGRNWAESDPKAALDWMHGLAGPQGASGDLLAQMVNIVNDWACVDPLGTAGYVQTLQGQPNFGRLISQIGTNWASADPVAALAWAQLLPADAGYGDAMSAVLTQLAIQDPKSAWSAALEMPEGGMRDLTLSNIVTKWSAQNPAQAIPALAALPEGSVRDSATTTLATNWLKKDPLAASQWITTLPAGAARDGAVVSLIATEGKNDLPTAFAWAASIGDSNKRISQLANVILQWAGRDPASATSAVQSANISDMERAGLLDFIQKTATAK